MHRLELLHRTPFRLALSFAVLFILAFVFSGIVIYQLMRADLSRRLDESAKEIFSVMAATYGDGDLEDLVATVNSHAQLTSPKEQLFSLSDAGGHHLAGNLVAGDPPEGFSVVREGTAGLPEGVSYRAYSGKVSGNRLTVALSYAQTEALEGIVLMGFGWASTLIVLLAVAGGAWLASRVQRRLDAVAMTMGNVSQGRLDARIPLMGSGDDIDDVSMQVNRALERLQSLVEGMRQVTNDVAHELKTPLNRLQIILETADNKSASGETISRELLDARTEIIQINETFEALLRIAQIEAGARKARFTDIDLDAIVDTIWEIYAEVAEDQGMSLVVKKTLQGPGGFVHGDSELLTQMFANLVENALRHCPKGTRVELSVRRDHDRILATVSDNGPGIPLEEHEKVFRSLYRLDKSRSTPGTGLGLSLVRTIAELHGATITLANRNPGLVVTVDFPALRQAHA